jgi:hypothetical protein
VARAAGWALPFERGRWSKRLIRQGQPAPDHLKLREARLLSLLLPILAGFFTWHIPGAIAFPKQGWADWLVVAVLIALIFAGWLATLATWCWSYRLHRERSGRPDM